MNKTITNILFGNSFFKSPALWFAAVCTAMAPMPALAQDNDDDDLRPYAEHFEPGERTRVAKIKVRRCEIDRVPQLEVDSEDICEDEMDGNWKRRTERVYATYLGDEFNENCVLMNRFFVEQERRGEVILSETRLMRAAFDEARVQACTDARTEAEISTLQRRAQQRVAVDIFEIATGIDGRGQLESVNPNANGGVTVRVGFEFSAETPAQASESASGPAATATPQAPRP